MKIILVIMWDFIGRYIIHTCNVYCAVNYVTLFQVDLAELLDVEFVYIECFIGLL